MDEAVVESTKTGGTQLAKAKNAKSDPQNTVQTVMVVLWFTSHSFRLFTDGVDIFARQVW